MIGAVGFRCEKPAVAEEADKVAVVADVAENLEVEPVEGAEAVVATTVEGETSTKTDGLITATNVETTPTTTAEPAAAASTRPTCNEGLCCGATGLGETVIESCQLSTATHVSRYNNIKRINESWVFQCIEGAIGKLSILGSTMILFASYLTILN